MRYRARVEGGTEPRSVRSCCSSLECARPLTSRLALRVHPTQCCRFVSRFLSFLDLAWVENRGEFRWLRQCSQIGTGETAETGQLWGISCPTIEAPDGIRIRQFGIQAARSQVGSRGSGRVCACPWFCRGRLRGSQALGGPPSRPGEPCRERARRSETALAAVSHLVPVVGNFPIRIWHPPHIGSPIWYRSAHRWQCTTVGTNRPVRPYALPGQVSPGPSDFQTQASPRRVGTARRYR